MRLIATIVLFLIAGPALALDQADRDAMSRGTHAITAPTPPPPIPLMSEVGDTFTLSDLPRQTTIVTFWATWCHACEIEMPRIAALHAEQRPGLTVLPVSVDRGDALDKVKRHFASHPDLADLPIVIDQNAALFERIGAFATPTSIIVDQYGQVVAAFVGLVNWDSAAMTRYLDLLAKAPDPETSRRILAN